MLVPTCSFAESFRVSSRTLSCAPASSRSAASARARACASARTRCSISALDCCVRSSSLRCATLRRSSATTRSRSWASSGSFPPSAEIGPCWENSSSASRRRRSFLARLRRPSLKPARMRVGFFNRVGHARKGGASPSRTSTELAVAMEAITVRVRVTFRAETTNPASGMAAAVRRRSRDNRSEKRPETGTSRKKGATIPVC